MKKLYIYGMFAMVAIISCNKTEISETSATGEQQEGYGVIYATTEPTKIAIVGTGINEYLEWLKGDKVAVYSNLNSQTATMDTPPVLYSADASGACVSFTGDPMPSGKYYYGATYPASAAVSCGWGPALGVNIPSVQNGSIKNVIFAGVPREAGKTSDLNKQFVFTAVSSVIKINVPASKQIHTIVLESSNFICGRFSATWDSKNLSWTDKAVSTNEKGKKITVIADDGGILSGDIYISVMPNGIENNSTTTSNIKITFASREAYVIVEKNGVSKFKANTIEDFQTFNKELTNVLGTFSVAQNKYIDFSAGNLQYQPLTQKWRFAEHQWSFVGGKYYSLDSSIQMDDGNVYYNNGESDIKCDNGIVLEDNASNYPGWIDLFGFGSNGKNGKKVLETSTEGSYSGYANNNLSNEDLTDWGSCKIGDDPAGTWRSLSQAEWSYLLKKGKSIYESASPYAGTATVNGVEGMILIPDVFFEPYSNEAPTSTDGSFRPRSLSTQEDYNSNIYSGTNWIKMESVGAVFLPSAGFRVSIGYNRYSQNNYLAGTYWTSTYGGGSTPYVTITPSQMYTTDLSTPSYGRSVRLVRDVE